MRRSRSPPPLPPPAFPSPASPASDDDPDVSDAHVHVHPAAHPRTGYGPYAPARMVQPRFPRLPPRGAGARPLRYHVRRDDESEEDDILPSDDDDDDDDGPPSRPGAVPGPTGQRVSFGPEMEGDTRPPDAVYDEGDAERDLLYVDEFSDTANSLTLPETLALAKGKLRRRRFPLSFHRGKPDRAARKRSPDIRRTSLDDSNSSSGGRTRAAAHAMLRRRNTTAAGDVPSCSTATSGSRASSARSRSFSRSSRPPLKNGEMEVQVRSWVLEGNGSGLRKTGKFGAWKKKNEPHKTVRVAANPSGLDPICLYASDQTCSDLASEPYKETEFITSKPEYIDKKSIVYQDSKFEIGVVGMSVSAQDFSLGGTNFNELLMFSLQREQGEKRGEDDSLPFIHYDPGKEEQFGGAEADQFIPIAASKSLFMASDGKVKNQLPRKSVNCQFKILELDKVNDFMQLSLAGIEQLGSYMSQFATATPFLGLLSPALSLASIVSRRAIESHAKPDKVLKIDMNFLLAQRQKSEVKPSDGTEISFEHRSGEYLRYGYYFFLAKRVEAKLYASFRTFPNVQLMLKRSERDLAPGEKRYFPLTGVSYLVIRVTPRVSSMAATRKAIRMSHVQRLEDLMRWSVGKEGSAEEAESIVKTLANLARDVGIGVDGEQGAEHTQQASAEQGPEWGPEQEQGEGWKAEGQTGRGPQAGGNENEGGA